jgi:hypothetical protein
MKFNFSKYMANVKRGFAETEKSVGSPIWVFFLIGFNWMPGEVLPNVPEQVATIVKWLVGGSLVVTVIYLVAWLGLLAWNIRTLPSTSANL